MEQLKEHINKVKEKGSLIESKKVMMIMMKMKLKTIQLKIMIKVFKKVELKEVEEFKTEDQDQKDLKEEEVYKTEEKNQEKVKVTKFKKE